MDCSICLEPILTINKLILPCFHNFHETCINEWKKLKKNKKTYKCPLCLTEYLIDPSEFIISIEDEIIDDSKDIFYKLFYSIICIIYLVVVYIVYKLSK